MGYKDSKSASGRSAVLCHHTILLHLHLGSFEVYKRETALKEYTILAAVSVLLTIFVDYKSGVRLLRKRLFYLFLLIVLSLELVVDGYLTGTGIVTYNPQFFSGIRIGSIPIEDFLFGFSMVTMTIVLWEYFRRKSEHSSSTGCP